MMKSSASFSCFLSTISNSWALDGGFAAIAEVDNENARQMVVTTRLSLNMTNPPNRQLRLFVSYPIIKFAKLVIYGGSFDLVW